MIDPLRVARNFLAEEDLRDDHGPYREEEGEDLSKDEALKFLRKLYPWMEIKTESMPGGLNYSTVALGRRREIGRYSFESRKLWYKIFPGTKKPWRPRKPSTKGVS